MLALCSEINTYIFIDGRNSEHSYLNTVISMLIDYLLNMINRKEM